MSKTLILLRHAHREVLEPGLDNGLSPKGLAQVERLVEHFHRYFQKEFPGAAPRFLCSPKKRCRETLTPIAKREDCELKIDPRLGELAPFEGGPEFRDRIRDFWEDWKRGARELTVVCSHGDWIPELVAMVTQARISLKKGGFVELREVAGEILLSGLIQKP